MAAQIKETNDTWTTVTVDTPDFLFPDLCPDCLSPNCTSFISVQADRGKFAGYYVVATRWKYTVFHVPFCAKCVDDLRKRLRLGRVLTPIGLVSGFGIGIWAELGSWPTAFLTAALCVPGIALQSNNCGVRFDIDERGALFRFKRKEYAEAFCQVNAPDDIGGDP